MYYRINKWMKVESGVYESDQRFFNVELLKHVGLYRIEKRRICLPHMKRTVWTVYKMENESDKVFKADFETLTEAKEFAEYDFGVTFKLDEIDIAG